MALWHPASAQDSLRLATFSSGLKRDGPGLLLRDIIRGEDQQILAALAIIARVKPDILLLTRFDFDLEQVALSAFADALRDHGVDYPYQFTTAPNSGVATGLDMDGDGWFGAASDAFAFGKFAGHGGMALLSRLPIDAAQVRDFSRVLWKDIPGTTLPVWPVDAQRSAGAEAIERLSSVNHWDIPVTLNDGTALHLLTYHAGTPAFDGPEDRNGLRNKAENLFWLQYLDGDLGLDAPNASFVIIGDANLDPVDGDGHVDAMRRLLTHPAIQDPQPKSAGATEAAKLQGGANVHHRGDPALDTADRRDVDGPGNLRVDYVLPSRDLTVLDAGVFWPASDEPGAELLADRDPRVSWHGLVWVDIRR